MEISEDFEARVKQASEIVDLDVAFSPVLPLVTGSHPAADVPVEVEKAEDGSFLLCWRVDTYAVRREPVTIEDLRVMRSRYILQHNDYYARLPTMGPRQRDRILNTFFGGRAVYMLGALELQAKQEPQDASQPIMTVPMPEGENGLQQALQTALEAMGPAVVLASRDSVRASRQLTPADVMGPGCDSLAEEARQRNVMEEIVEMMKDAASRPPKPEPSPDEWRLAGPGWRRSVNGYDMRVWPAGTWSISKAGVLAAYGSGGRDKADERLNALLAE